LRRFEDNKIQSLGRNIKSNMVFGKRDFTNISTVSTSSTRLQMSYLPPSGGNNNNKSELSEILTGVASIAATFLFFMSPLGSIFFAITNSLFLLALITPVLIYTGFQIWLKFNTVQGPCPNCDFDMIVTKEDDAAPSMCLNCGSFVRASKDKNSLELCSDGRGMSDMGQDDGFFSNDFFSDIFSGGSNDGMDTVVTPEQKQKKKERETTVIDIDVIE